MTRIDKACYERGCACYDDRVDGDAVEVVLATERPVDCERCNRLEEHAYDLVGKLRVANIKLSMPPQRTWVGLTDEEIKPCWHEACQTDLELTSQLVVYFARAIEAKLKELNT